MEGYGGRFGSENEFVEKQKHYESISRQRNVGFGASRPREFGYRDGRNYESMSRYREADYHYTERMNEDWNERWIPGRHRGNPRYQRCNVHFVSLFR